MKEAGQIGITGRGVILTEAALVLTAGVLWWFMRDTPFLKSAWLPWVAVMFPIMSLAVPWVLTIRNKNISTNGVAELQRALPSYRVEKDEQKWSYHKQK